MLPAPTAQLLQPIFPPRQLVWRLEGKSPVRAQDGLELVPLRWSAEACRCRHSWSQLEKLGWGEA